MRSLKDIHTTGVAWATEEEFDWLCTEIERLRKLLDNQRNTIQKKTEEIQDRGFRIAQLSEELRRKSKGITEKFG